MSGGAAWGRVIAGPLTAVGDLICLAVAFRAALALRFAVPPPAGNLQDMLVTAPWIGLAAVAVYWLLGLYTDEEAQWHDRFYALLAANVLLFLSGMAFSYFFRAFAFPRSIFLLAAAVAVPLSTAWRYLVWRLSWERRRRLVTLVLGPGKEARALAVAAREQGRRVEVADVPPSDLQAMADMVTRMRPWQVIVAPGIEPRLRRDLVEHALACGATPLVVPELYDLLILGSRYVGMGDHLALRVEEVGLRRTGRVFKRLTDLILGTAMLVLLLPLMILVALVVRLDSRGPVLYRQERVGLGGRRFILYKFRTMVPDAEAATGPVLSSSGDPRVTRAGRVLRAARLDELPQLWNVLRGDMSLVGPRPERPCLVQEYEREVPGYCYRHRVPGGLTGLGQVNGHYEIGAAEKLRYDLTYTRRWTPLEDIKILARTFKVALMRSLGR